MIEKALKYSFLLSASLAALFGLLGFCLFLLQSADFLPSIEMRSVMRIEICWFTAAIFTGFLLAAVTAWRDNMASK